MDGTGLRIAWLTRSVPRAKVPRAEWEAKNTAPTVDTTKHCIIGNAAIPPSVSSAIAKISASKLETNLLRAIRYLF